VHVVSGRIRETLDLWLGDLPISLHAEHGVWSRAADGGAWRCIELPEAKWREPVRQLFEDFAARTPGSLVEEKTTSIAWHYRMTDPEFGASQANELRLHLASILSNEPVEILPVVKAIEVRPHGLDKGRVVETVVAAAPAGSVLAALGDDRTDEDMFAALPADALTIHVGPSASSAPLRLSDVWAARAFLASLLPKRA
jgi:trehalose 6-phosphate synthase/phosphatase